MADEVTTPWDAMEAEWQQRIRYNYRHTDIVALLREAEGHVRAFTQSHPQCVAALQAAASKAAPPAATAEGAPPTRKRRQQESGTDGEEEDDDEREGEGPGTTPRGGAAKAEKEEEELHRLCATRNDADYGELYKRLVKIQAPMVRFSRPPFRKLCRLWGTDISYTHMILAESCKSSASARHADFGVYKGEDKLVVQLAANCGPSAAQAARYLLPYCDAFDLNCGCPQRWAIKEGLGSALLEKPELVADMVKCIRNGVEGFCFETSGATASAGGTTSTVACAVKLRVHDDDVRRSVEFSRQLAAAGVAWVSVHGRTPTDTPSAPVRYEAIRLIKEELAKCHVPVVANGAVVSPSTAVCTALATGVGAVMCANGLLDNPAAFYLPESGQALLEDFTFAPREEPEELTRRSLLSLLGGRPYHGQEEEEHGDAEVAVAQWRQLVAQRKLYQQRSLLAAAKPECRPLTAALDVLRFRPLWSLPNTPVEVLSDFLRASLQMDLPYSATVQHTVRLGRSYLSSAERAQLSSLKSNAAVLTFFDELGLYTDRGRFSL